jgi:hypothetical protein
MCAFAVALIFLEFTIIINSLSWDPTAVIAEAHYSCCGQVVLSLVPKPYLFAGVDV